MLMEADLPDDVDALRALVLEQAHELDLLKVFRAENERLRRELEAATQCAPESTPPPPPPAPEDRRPAPQEQFFKRW